MKYLAISAVPIMDKKMDTGILNIPSQADRGKWSPSKAKDPISLPQLIGLFDKILTFHVRRRHTLL